MVGMEKRDTDTAQLMSAAARAYGSRAFFAKYLGVTVEELKSWMDGTSAPTEAQIRAAAEVLSEKKKP
jgi:DNA-binding transcriptional regulator YiaG